MAGLNAFIQRLEKFTATDIKQRVAEKAAPVLHAECLRGFIEQRNPYGTPWAARKDPRGTWKILDKTGAGVESLTSTAINGAVRLKILGRMRFHQDGTKRMVPRLIFPDPMYGLGMWAHPVNDAARAAVRELVGK
jgi:hypothetical protein